MNMKDYCSVSVFLCDKWCDKREDGLSADDKQLLLSIDTRNTNGIQVTSKLITSFPPDRASDTLIHLAKHCAGAALRLSSVCEY